MSPEISPNYLDEVEAYVDHFRRLCGETFDEQMAYTLAHARLTHNLVSGSEERVGAGDSTFLALEVQAHSQRLELAWPAMSPTARENVARCFRLMSPLVRNFVRGSNGGTRNG